MFYCIPPPSPLPPIIFRLIPHPYSLHLIPYTSYLVPFSLFLVLQSLHSLVLDHPLHARLSVLHTPNQSVRLYLIPYTLYLIPSTLHLTPYTFYLFSYSLYCRACIHLCSIIPFMPDSQSFIGDLDLWCTSKQFLGTTMTTTTTQD